MPRLDLPKSYQVSYRDKLLTSPAVTLQKLTSHTLYLSQNMWLRNLLIKTDFDFNIHELPLLLLEDQF